MANQSEINTSKNLKLYDEVIQIKKLCENQEKNLNEFDLTISSLPMDTIRLLKQSSSLIFETGLQDLDQINLEFLFHECLKERIEYLDVIKRLQFENHKLEEVVNNELLEIKNIEDGKINILKSTVPEYKITEEVGILEKQISAMQEKQSQFSLSSVKCIDQLLLKLEQIDLKRNIKEKKQNKNC